MPRHIDLDNLTPQQERYRRANLRKKENREKRELDAFYAADRPGGLSAFYRSREFRMVYGGEEMSDARN